MMFVRNGFTFLSRRFLPIVALVALFAAMGATWRVAPAVAKPTSTTASPAGRAGAADKARRAQAEDAEDNDNDDERPTPRAKRELTGKLNLNTATEEQLQLLPTVGPSKAERIVAWRKKNGGFKRAADLRKVKGFGYKTLKRLEPYLEVSGETTLAEK